jgi:hypothetical protein
LTERRGRVGVVNAQPFALLPVRGRRHAEFRGRAAVQPRRRIEARIDGRARHAFAALQRRPQRGAASGRLVLARRDADDALEQALQMERAHVHGFAELRERQACLGIRVECRASALDDGHVARQALGPAALAGAIPGGARLVGRGVERHVFTPRQARRARGPAKHPRRRHGVEERAVGPRVPADDGIPALGIGVIDGVHDLPRQWLGER